MPEKTKLEDYVNMNNTGFAFIDLNEELKETLKSYSEFDGNQPDCFYAYFNAKNKEVTGYDITDEYIAEHFKF